MNFLYIQDLAKNAASKYKTFEEFSNNYQKATDDFYKDVSDLNNKISESAKNVKETQYLYKNRHNVGNLDGEKITITSLADNERKQKTEYQNKIMHEASNYLYTGIVFYETKKLQYVNIKRSIAGLEPLTEIDAENEGQVDRDVMNFLKPCSKTKGMNEKLLDDLSKSSTELERKDIFENYFNDLLDLYDNTCPRYKNEQDLLENFQDIFGLTNTLSADPSMFTALEESFQFKMDDKIKQRYVDHLDYAHKNLFSVSTKIQAVIDETYNFLSEDSIKQLNDYNPDISEYYVYSFENNGSVKEKPYFLSDFAQDHERNEMKLKGVTFNFYKAAKEFDENTKFLGPKGEISMEEAQNLVNTGVRVDALNNDGTITKMQQDKNGFAMPQDDIIGPLDLNNEEDCKFMKDQFKECLNTLNSGTSLFNISSSEYKNMRSILSRLSGGLKNKDNTVDKIKELKELGNKYLKNHDKKEKISDIALKRKNCVLNVLDKLSNLDGALDIDPSLEKQFINENQKQVEQNNERQKIDVYDLNSTIDNFDSLSREEQEKYIRTSESLNTEKQEEVQEQKTEQLEEPQMENSLGVLKQ